MTSIQRIALSLGICVGAGNCALGQTAGGTTLGAAPGASGPTAMSLARIDLGQSGVRTFRLPSRIVIHGATGACATAHTVKVKTSDASERAGEPALVEQAVRAGKALRVMDARCESDGVVVGSSLAVDAEVVSVDVCKLPGGKGGALACGK